MVEHTHVAGDRIEFPIFHPYECVFRLAAISFSRKFNNRVAFVFFIGPSRAGAMASPYLLLPFTSGSVEALYSFVFHDL